jgi:hypothetical protein
LGVQIPPGLPNHSAGKLNRFGFHALNAGIELSIFRSQNGKVAEKEAGGPEKG